ncbi:MAG: hypothetical protein ABII71_01860 [Candidatus Micrarchaeota archaeon]
MRCSLIPGMVTVVSPTHYFESTGIGPEGIVPALNMAVKKLSKKAGIPSENFFQWLSKMRLTIDGIALFGGEYHQKDAGKLELMLAFAGRESYLAYVNDAQTPEIVDTRISPYLLGFDGGTRMLRQPQSFFDALLGGEILLLRDSDSRLEALIRERQRVFIENAEEKLFELITHSVFADTCREQGLLGPQHTNHRIVRSMFPKPAANKLEALSVYVSEEEIGEKAARRMHSMRLKKGTAIAIARKMALGLQRHSSPLPKPLKRAVSGQGRVR